MTIRDLKDKAALARQTRPVAMTTEVMSAEQRAEMEKALERILADAPDASDPAAWEDDDYGLQGGQGREPRDLDAAAGVMFAIGAILGLAVVAGVAFWALARLAGVR